MAVPVVESTDTPEIRWPVPRDPRALDDEGQEGLELPDTRLPTRAPLRRGERERRGARLRWGLLWLSALFGGFSAWLWLSRQDQMKKAQFAVEREIQEIALLRVDLERAPELKAASLNLYVEKMQNRQAAITQRLAALPETSPLRTSWTTELQALSEAKADLDWLQPRWRQLSLLEGAKLSDAIKANEASLRPPLDRFAAQSTSPGARFRPGLARGLLMELDRRMTDVRAAAAANALPPLPPDQPMVLKAEKKPAPKAAPPAKAKTLKAAKKAPAKRTAVLAKDSTKPDQRHRRPRVTLRDDSSEEIIRATRSMRARR